MPDIDLLSYFTHSLTLYGPLVIGLAMLIAPFGVPIPSTPILIAAGAMVRTGALEWSSFALVMLVSVVLSDCMSFAMGNYAGQRFINSKRLSNSKIWGTAQSKIQQNAAFAVVISHSLITSLGLPVNLLSGTSNYAFSRFLLWDVVGRILWILAYGGIGFLLGSQANLLELFSGRLLPWILIFGVGLLVIYKCRKVFAGWLRRIRGSRSALNGTKWAGRSVT